MSRYNYTDSLPSGYSGASRKPGFAVRIGVLLDTVAMWQERRRQRLALASLDDHMLHDIGISRADVEAEVTRPFWS
jgi:uncharacterized protein YjiS (DUF1127 family)